LGFEELQEFFGRDFAIIFTIITITVVVIIINQL